MRFAQQIIRNSLSVFKCPKKVCGKSFLNEEYLPKHLLVDHPGKAWMIWPLRDHFSIFEKPYKCTNIQTCIDKRRSSRQSLDDVWAKPTSWRLCRHDVRALLGSSRQSLDDVWAKPTSWRQNRHDIRASLGSFETQRKLNQHIKLY
jgi:hypothetical protein